MGMDIKQSSLICGFTLLELLLVVSIIGLLSMAALFSSWQGTNINLAGQAEQLANDIRYAQSLAMTKGQRYRWVETSSTTYQIQNNSGTAIILAQGNTTVTLSSGITFGTLTNLPNSLINFDGTGTPYSNTTAPGAALSANAIIPMIAGNRTLTIVVAAGTGGVSVP